MKQNAFSRNRYDKDFIGIHHIDVIILDFHGILSPELLSSSPISLELENIVFDCLTVF